MLPRTFLAVLVLVLGAMAQAPAAQAPAAKKSALDKPAMEAYVRHLRLYVPAVKVTVADPKPSDVPGFLEVTTLAQAGDASESLKFYVSKDGQKVLEASVYDINKNPFQPALDRIKTDLEPSIGTPGAPVVIVLFSDFQCSYCKQEAESIRKELLKAFPTQVRLYFKNYPIPQIHPWARPAALTGRCIFTQKPLAFWEYHDWIFSKQTEVTVENFEAKAAEFVQSKGLDSGAIKACAASKATADDIDRTTAEGRALDVTSTPTMFINGRKIPGYLPWENLKQIVEFEANYQVSAKNAGEHCCRLASPSLLNPGPNPVLPK